jgi:Pyruvate:ferredoxin oxidoreductase and related 2-oxoacid:ferredoxin oxidoreductases, gamma subunit
VRTEIILAGKGGQGILLAGYLIGYSVAKFTDYQVSSTEEYGAETRGTDSKMDIVIADEEIDFIGAERADIAIFMFKDQAAKYAKYVKDGATVIIDSTLVNAGSLPRSWRVMGLPFTELAEKNLGTPRVANMIMLGAFSSLGLVPINALENAVKEVVNPRWVELNIKALHLGLEEGRKLAVTQAAH